MSRGNSVQKIHGHKTSHHSDWQHAGHDSVVESLTGCLTGENLALLLSTIKKYFKDDRDLMQELIEAYEIVCQLNLELMNMFDNFICFSGKGDEARMLRLLKSATERALTALRSSNHKNTGSAEILIKNAAAKLSLYYQEQNKIIEDSEKMYVLDVVCRAKEAYRTKLHSYANIDQANLEDVRQKMLCQCIKSLDGSLDFSGKMNNIHTKAVTDFEIWAKQEQIERQNQGHNSKSNAAVISRPEQEYKLLIDAKWEEINTREESNKLHEFIKNKLNDKVGPEKMNAAGLQIDRYFGHIREKFENRFDNHQTLFPVYLCVSGNSITLYALDRAKNIQNPIPSSEQATTVQCFDKDPKYDIFMFFCYAEKDELLETSSQMKQLIKAFTEHKRQEEARSRKAINWAIVPVPSWFGINAQMGLRTVCYNAGYQKVSLTYESALIAHSLIETYSSSTICVASVGPQSAMFEIYEKQNDSLTKLIGVSSFVWKKLSPKQNETGQTGSFSLKRYIKSYKFEKPNQAALKQRVDILLETYKIALKQTNRSQRKQKQLCYLWPTLKGWKDAYLVFVDQMADSIQNIENQETEIALKSCLKLVNSRAQICDMLITHSLDDSHSHNTKMKSDILSGENPTGKWNYILRACMQIRKLIEDKTVRVGPLTGRIIVEHVKKLESLCSEGTKGEFEVLQQSKTLQKLINQYKFNIQII